MRTSNALFDTKNALDYKTPLFMLKFDGEDVDFCNYMPAGFGSNLAPTSCCTDPADDQDVTALHRRIQRHLVNAIEADEELQWRDSGYLLVWPLALLILIWFRRGWTIQWQ